MTTSNAVRRVAHGHRVRELDLDLAARRAEQRLDRGVVDLLAAEHPGLVQQRERVPRGALCVPSDRVRGGIVQHHTLGRRDLLEQLREPFHRVPAEVEPLAAPDDRGGHLVRLGGGEDEANARGRLLEDLQQRIEGLP